MRVQHMQSYVLRICGDVGLFLMSSRQTQLEGSSWPWTLGAVNPCWGSDARTQLDQNSGTQNNVVGKIQAGLSLIGASFSFTH